jgi:predicted DNA-binding protein
MSDAGLSPCPAKRYSLALARNMEKQRTTIFLSPAQRAALRALSLATDLPASYHIREAIDAYLRRPAVRAMLSDAARAAERIAEGVPLPRFARIENTVFFRALPPEQQQQIRDAASEDEKRRLMEQFLLLAEEDPGRSGENRD